MDLKQKIEIIKILQLKEISKPYRIKNFYGKVSIIMSDFNYDDIRKIINFIFIDGKEIKNFNVNNQMIETNYDTMALELVNTFEDYVSPLNYEIFRDEKGNIDSIDFYISTIENLVDLTAIDFFSNKIGFRYNMQDKDIKIYFK